MIDGLRLAPNVISRYLPGEGLYVVTEHQADVLLGSVFGALLPLLDGKLSVNEILDRAGIDHSEPEILYALNILEGQGYLANGLTHGFAAKTSSNHLHITNNKVKMSNHSSYPFAELTNLLATQGIEIQDFEDNNTYGLHIVLVDDYLDNTLSQYNNIALTSKKPWMLVKPTGNILWFGPIFVPDETGCWECLTNRLRINRRVLRYLERRLDTTLSFPSISTPSTQNLAASMSANLVAQWLNNDPNTKGILCTFDTKNQTFEKHLLSKRPQCKACGTPTPPPTPILLELNDETRIRDGGFRTRTSLSTFQSLSQHVSQITGVVNFLRPLETGDDNIYVYVAGQNFGATGGTLNILAKTIRSQSSGKGITEIQAKTSALCESIERYSAVFQGDESYILGTIDEFKENAIEPNSCMLFSETQYEEREKRNVGADGFTRIPQPLGSQQQLWWSPVWSLIDQKQKYCPTAYLYFHSDVLRDPIGVRTCLPDSNGNATGSTYSEAILQGLLELIERDSTALWWYPRTLMPQVDLKSFRSDFLDTCQRYHHNIGRELWVLDVTNDLGIPSFVGISRKTTGKEHIIMGFGAHVDAFIAVQRAVSETNQLLAGVNARLKSNDNYSDATSNWLDTATVEEEYYLLPRTDLTKKANDYPTPPSTISNALDKCLEAVQQIGLEPYAIDLTRRDIDLKVVKVICPGIRHFWSRFAPGRLYEVPLALGRVAKKQKESDMNPIAMFL